MPPTDHEGYVGISPATRSVVSSRAGVGWPRDVEATLDRHSRYVGAVVEDDDRLEAVAAAIAHARAHDLSSWDREVARFAIRRWHSYERRRKRAATSDKDARVADLARGLIERFDPARMDDPGWQRWTAEAAADVLRQS